MRNEKARLLIRRAFGSAPIRTRTYNPLIKSQQTENSKMHPAKGLCLAYGFPAHHLPTDTFFFFFFLGGGDCQTDPDPGRRGGCLTRAARGDHKAGILAMVKAASKKAHLALRRSGRVGALPGIFLSFVGSAYKVQLEPCSQTGGGSGALSIVVDIDRGSQGD